MQRKKTRLELIDEVYLQQTHISTLFKVPISVAHKVYLKAKEIDQCELKYFIYENRVRTNSVCKVLGVNLNTLQKQIKSTLELTAQSAS